MDYNGRLILDSILLLGFPRNGKMDKGGIELGLDFGPGQVVNMILVRIKHSANQEIVETIMIVQKQNLPERLQPLSPNFAFVVVTVRHTMT